jgi:hypothetical protein
MPINERAIPPLRLAAALLLASGTAASAQSLTPPDFLLDGHSWAYSPAYTRQLTGTETVNAFRLIATAHPRIGTGAAWHSDIELRLLSPGGVSLIVGGSGTNWSDPAVFLNGTPPAQNGQLQFIDATFTHNFGPIDGQWSVNFYNTWSSGGLNWTNIEVIPLELVAGACCFPSGACDVMLAAACTAGGGTYHGDNSDCITVNCPQPPTGACCLPNGSCVIDWEGGCIAQGGLYHGNGTDCAAITCPNRIDTNWTGPSNAGVDGAGAYFLVEVTDPQGIEIAGFDINTNAAAGTPITAQVYFRPITFVGFTGDISAWVLMGEVATTAAGPGFPTFVPVGGLNIGGGETWALRVGSSAGVRYIGSGTHPFFSDSHVTLHMGEVQNSFFGTSTLGNYPTDLRGWSGAMYYYVGATITTGACCMPDGSCEEIQEVICIGQGGTYAGAHVTCAAANCPQPPTGACCLPNGSCVIDWEGGCHAQGGLYQGNGTDCAAITCPHRIDTNWTGPSLANVNGAGAYFLVEVTNPQGIEIAGFDINTDAAAGTPITAHVYFRPITFVGFTGDISAWILMGEVPTTAAGPGFPTLVPVGGLHIGGGETWALRVGSSAGVRYIGSGTHPFFSDSHVTLHMGEVQNSFFGTSTFGTYPADLRGWSGAMYYHLGAIITTGTCCMPDGSCEELQEIICTSQGGIYHGDGTTCATTLPGGCPQPATGACCFNDGSCTIDWSMGCTHAGGTYMGDNTTCAGITCPTLLVTDPPNNGLSAAGSGIFLDLTATDALTVVRMDYVASSSAGSHTEAQIWTKIGPYVG